MENLSRRQHHTPVTSASNYSFSTRRTLLIPSATSAFHRVPQRAVHLDAEPREINEWSEQGNKTIYLHECRRPRSRDTSSIPQGLPQNKNVTQYKSLDDFSRQSQLLVTDGAGPSFRNKLENGWQGHLSYSPIPTKPTHTNYYKSPINDINGWPDTGSWHRSPEFRISSGTCVGGRGTAQSATDGFSNLALTVKHATRQDRGNAYRDSSSLTPSAVNDDATYIQPQLLTPSSPCKLLMDIVRESHLSAFPQSPISHQNQSRDSLYSISSPVSNLTSPFTSTKVLETTARQQSLSSTPLSTTESNVCPPFSLSSPLNDKNFTSDRSGKAAVTSGQLYVKSPPCTAASQNAPRPTSSIMLRVLPPEAVKSTAQLTPSRKQEPVEGQHLLPINNSPQSVVNVASVTVNNPELSLSRQANDNYNIITDVLDSAIARLSNGNHSTSANASPSETTTPVSSKQCSERCTDLEHLEKDKSSSSEEPSDDDSGSSRSSGSSCSLRRNNVTSKTRAGHSKLAAELKIVQRRLVFHLSKDDSFNRDESPIDQHARPLPLPQESVIKRHRHRQERHKTSSSSTSSSSSSSSQSSVSRQSKHDISSQEPDEYRRQDFSSDRRHRRLHVGRDTISPLLNTELTELDWHTANN